MCFHLIYASAKVWQQAHADPFWLWIVLFFIAREMAKAAPAASAGERKTTDMRVWILFRVLEKDFCIIA